MPRTRAELLAARAEHARAIAAKLAEARREAGLSQAAAARSLGRPQTFIAKLERGERTLTFEEACDLADLYGVSLDRFSVREARRRGSAA